METKRSDTTVVLYFDNIGEEAVHLQMSAFQKHEVENAKPANVIIYDYYDNSKCFGESCTIIAACSNKYYSYSSSLCSIVLRDRCLNSWKCLPNRKPAISGRCINVVILKHKLLHQFKYKRTIKKNF